MSGNCDDRLLIRNAQMRAGAAMAALEVTAFMDHVERIRREGFTVLERVLAEPTIARIKGELTPYLQRQHMGRNDFEGFASERVYALLAKAPAVAELVEHPAVLALVDALLPLRPQPHS